MHVRKDNSMNTHLIPRFRANAQIRSAANTAVTLIYPRRCPFCDEPVKPWNALVCAECRQKFSYIEMPYCLKCGKHISDSGREYCGDCAAHPHIYDSGRALFSYRGVSASVARFKYRGRREYAAYYAACIVEELGGFIRSCRAEALIPVPLHKSRRRKRGYNQAQVLAEELAALTGIPVRADLIERVEKTAPMKDLSAVERQNNLKKAFKIRQNDVKLSTIVIIDDIYTTGSTIDAMAQAFTEAGIPGIYFITLTIGRGI